MDAKADGFLPSDGMKYTIFRHSCGMACVMWRFPIFFLAGEALRRPARFCTDLGKRESPFKFDLRYNAKR